MNSDNISSKCQVNLIEPFESVYAGQGRCREFYPGIRLLGRLDKLFTERNCEITAVCLLALTALPFLAPATDCYQGQSQPIRLESAFMSDEH